MILFLTGKDYYNQLIQKSDLTWYEQAYVYYYKNFKGIYLIMLWIAMMYVCSLHDKPATCRFQSGGFLGFSKYKVAGMTTALTEGAASRLQATGDAAKKVVSLDTYKKLGKGAVNLGSKGISKGVSMGERLAESYKEAPGGAAGLVAFVFIGFGFMVFIFPVLAMGILGALTFLIARNTLVDTFTA